MIGVQSSYNKGSKFAFSIVLGLEKFWIQIIIISL
jgi:hypothetical protein